MGYADDLVSTASILNGLQRQADIISASASTWRSPSQSYVWRSSEAPKPSPHTPGDSIINEALSAHDGAGPGEAQLGRLCLCGLGAPDIKGHTEHFDGAGKFDFYLVGGPPSSMNEECLLTASVNSLVPGLPRSSRS